MEHLLNILQNPQKNVKDANGDTIPPCIDMD